MVRRAAGWPLIPQSPGSRPGASMGPASERTRDCNPVRLRGCRIEAPSASWGTVTWRTNEARARLKRGWLSWEVSGVAWHAGWPLIPQSPGSRPGASMGQGEGLPVLSGGSLTATASAGRTPAARGHAPGGRPPSRPLELLADGGNPAALGDSGGRRDTGARMVRRAAACPTGHLRPTILVSGSERRSARCPTCQQRNAP
jgi:hypothetical protein